MTRQLIVDAARNLFYTQGYYGTSIDQIAIEAGASRATFYLHFRDKEEVFSELVDNYVARIREWTERLPGPNPTLAELRAWLAGLAVSLEREKLVFTALSEVSSHEVGSPVFSRRLLDAWISNLSHRIPAFAAATRKSKRGIEARAAADLMIIEITWAAASTWQQPDYYSEVAFDIVAQRLHVFLDGAAPTPARPRAPRKGGT
jgi:AcrR family transcriptional regulator